MSLLENFNLVYGSDMRILDLSVEVNASTGIGSQFHLEPFHTMRWVGTFAGSESVFADDQSIAFRGHQTETMIPHLPIPPWPLGVPLAKTIIVDSKCHIYCHNADLEIEGKQVGVAMLILAPPFHCASIQLPASLGGLGKMLDKVPAIPKLKAALGGLHKLNAQMAKIDGLNRKLQGILEGARVGQVAGSAVLGTLEVLQQMRQASDEVQDGQREQGLGVDAHPMHAAQEMLRSEADYQKARNAVEQGGKPGVEYYQRAHEMDLLSRKIHRRELETRALVSAYEEAQLEVQQQRELRGGVKASTPKHCPLKKAEHKLRSVSHALQESVSKTKRDKACLACKGAEQDTLLGQLPSAPTHKPLGVMLPSLTSFSASSFAHTVKIGMSPASYWRMQLKVLAIVSADLIDYGLGLVGDALLVDGPSSRVGSWVAELASGAFQGLAGSRMRAYGQDAPLDFSVPIKTGSLLAGGLIQGRAEFYFRALDANEPSSESGAQETAIVASRVGVDGPGRAFDTVQVHEHEAAAGLHFEIPEIW